MGLINAYIRELAVLCAKEYEFTLNNPKERYKRLLKDALYFAENGWEFDDKYEAFEKNFHVTTGSFKGRYRMRIEFNADYPFFPPAVFLKKIGGNNVTEHLEMGTQYSTKWGIPSICIESKNGGRDDWWRESMNVDTAVKMALLVVNGEMDRKKIIKNKEPKRRFLKGYEKTIYGRMEKEGFNKTTFVNNIKKTVKTPMNESWSWPEIAYELNNKEAGVKRIVNNYYLNKRKEK